MELDGPFQIIVVDDSGYANVRSSDGPVPVEVKLLSWAKIKGIFMVGPNIGANTLLDLSTDIERDGSSNISVSYNLSTDEQGRFEGDRIFPGKADIGKRIIRMVNTGATEVTSSIRERIELKAGETTEVQIGGTGRPVVGQILPVEGASEEPNWRFASVHVSAGKSVKPPEMPELATQEERTKWWQEWIKTDGGKEWQKQSQEYQKIRDASPYFNASVDRDGKFRIDDMPEGDYELNLYLGEQYARIVNNHQFTVPPMEDERSDEPLDLGEIRLEKNPR
jgi:hypothetical protein